jgi:hypothetical protein
VSTAVSWKTPVAEAEAIAAAVIAERKLPASVIRGQEGDKRLLVSVAEGRFTLTIPQHAVRFANLVHALVLLEFLCRYAKEQAVVRLYDVIEHEVGNACYRAYFEYRNKNTDWTVFE